LADGDFDRWFRDRNRHDLVARAQSARLEPDINAALEAFLRRLDPRLPPPRLTVEPQSLDFGWVKRSGKRGTSRSAVFFRLTLRNKGRGYAQVRSRASVPWIVIEPAETGCLSGNKAEVKVSIDPEALPLRRDHQAVITCAPSRGARVSIPVTAELNLVGEALWRFLVGLRSLLVLMGRGARRGLGIWTRTFSSMVRSRIGPWVLLVETVVLAVVMVILWSTWRGPLLDIADVAWTFIQALPLALVAVYLLPALAFVSGAIAWELGRALLWRVRMGRGASDAG
jgi:hypothetical protein